MPKKIPSPVCGFRAVHAEAVRNRWGSVKTSYITVIPIARATTHPGSSGVGFFILSCSHPAMASQRQHQRVVMTRWCVVLFVSSQQRPTKANAGQRRPTQAHEGPQQLTTANEGQRRPTKTKKGPNDDRYVFFMYNHFILFLQRVVIP